LICHPLFPKGAFPDPGIDAQHSKSGAQQSPKCRYYPDPEQAIQIVRIRHCDQPYSDKRSYQHGVAQKTVFSGSPMHAVGMNIISYEMIFSLPYGRLNLSPSEFESTQGLLIDHANSVNITLPPAEFLPSINDY
jgi:hypothetical protein